MSKPERLNTNYIMPSSINKMFHVLNNIYNSKNIYFLIYLLIMLLQLSHFHPFTPLHPAHSLPPTCPPYSSCPWVILISSLASTFPTLFLPSPYFPPIIYAIYSLYLSPLPPPPNPLLITLHVISISVVLFLF